MKPVNGIDLNTRECIKNTIREMNDAGCRMTILGVAKEAGISNATFHNRYPDLATEIRELAGKEAEQTSRKTLSKRQGRINKLNEQRKTLRDEVTELKYRLNQSRSVNAALDLEKQLLIAANEELESQLIRIKKVKILDLNFPSIG